MVRTSKLLVVGACVAGGLVACSLVTDLTDLGAGGTDAATDTAIGDGNIPGDAGSDGASPNACADAAPEAWTSIAPGMLPGRDQAAVFWTGTEYLVFGGTQWSNYQSPELDPDGAAPPVPDGGYALGCGFPGAATCSDGARYNPVTDTWTRVSNVGSPAPFRWDMSWAFGGGQLFTFGGHMFNNTGGWLYDLASDTWKKVTTVNEPTPRAYHASYYVNGRFFVWGGESLDAPDASEPSGTPLASGAYYDPSTDVWYPINASTGFAGTAYYATASSGTDFYVWGGTTDTQPWLGVIVNVTNAGAIYNYATNSWKAMSTVNAPDPRVYAAAVWTGSKLVVYGGAGANKTFQDNTGGIYDPKTDTWDAMSMTNAPTLPISPNTMVWSGKRVLVWGYPQSLDGGRVTAAGAIFDPAANVWDGPITSTNAPIFSSNMSAGSQNGWNGTELLMWGGEPTDAGSLYAYPTSGALYTPPCAP